MLRNAPLSAVLNEEVALEGLEGTTLDCKYLFASENVILCSALFTLSIPRIPYRFMEPPGDSVENQATASGEILPQCVVTDSDKQRVHVLPASGTAKGFRFLRTFGARRPGHWRVEGTQGFSRPPVQIQSDYGQRH